MIVYRVEHKDVVDPETGHAAGPFRSTSFYTAWDCDHKRLNAYIRAQEDLYVHILNGYYPTPWADPTLNTISPNEVCGFDSEDAFRDWFGATWPEFEAVGFRLAKYEVPAKDARRGLAGQVLFKFKNAEPVEV